MSGQFSLKFNSGLLIAVIFIGLCHRHVEGQANKVSPKLDFDEGENQNNSQSDIPVVTGVGQGRSAGGTSTTSGGNDENNSGGGVSTTISTSGGGGKSGPKIHGVRVTVDTGDTPKSKESKESVEIPDVGKHKKRVGIHTDITFEISADGDIDTNTTSSAQDGDKEDASVPIFRGRGSTTHKPRKSYDPKTHWNPNFSAERRSYQPGYYYPQYYPHNVPVYTSSGDSRGGGSVYRRGDGWNTYVPSGNLWTTERNRVEPYRPNAVTGHRSSSPNWKPCYCLTAVTDTRQRRDSRRPSVLRPVASSVIGPIDGKLDKPFSK